MNNKTCPDCGKPEIPGTPCSAIDSLAAPTNSSSIHSRDFDDAAGIGDLNGPHDPAEPHSFTLSPSILSEASTLISGPRRDSYGDVHESFARVSTVWTALLGHPITPAQVALLMTAFKLCREAHRPGHDNRVDICGYTALMDQLLQPLSTPPST